MTATLTDSARADVTFASMGSDVRLLVEGPRDVEAAVRHGRAWLEDYAARLSRFEPDSELCVLNADPRSAPPASPLLRAAVGAGLWAAERTNGLVDPTLVGELEVAGYAASRHGMRPVPLREALAAAPPRQPARPRPGAPWRAAAVDHVAGVVRRPPGVRFDTGGTGKGLAADALAHRLAEHDRVAVDCGGDIRVGGVRLADAPLEVQVAHPLTGETVATLWLGGGAVATSGLDVRVWRTGDGGFAHHLLDPSTGHPAWTGLVGATALAPTALEAETIAKAALLSGPATGRTLLAAHGGILFHDDETTERVALAGA